MQLKKIVADHKNIFQIASFIYNRLLAGNKIRIGIGNELNVRCALLYRCRIRIDGYGNRVSIEKLSRLNNCKIEIHGNDNRIKIGESVYLNETALYIEDNDNHITFGEHSSVQGCSRLSAIEGTRIKIGKDCLLSGNLDFRTGDSHSVLDCRKKRINLSRDIIIGDHVWIGNRVICLKGTRIPDGCIVGEGSLLNKTYKNKNCILAGVPAREVKEDIGWCHKRI